MSHDCGTRRACRCSFALLSWPSRMAVADRRSSGFLTAPCRTLHRPQPTVPTRFRPCSRFPTRPRGLKPRQPHPLLLTPTPYPRHTRHNLDPASALGPAASRDLSPEPDRGEDIGTGARRRKGERPRITKSRFHPLFDPALTRVDARNIEPRAILTGVERKEPDPTNLELTVLRPPWFCPTRNAPRSCRRTKSTRSGRLAIAVNKPEPEDPALVWGKSLERLKQVAHESASQPGSADGARYGEYGPR